MIRTPSGVGRPHWPRQAQQRVREPLADPRRGQFAHAGQRVGHVRRHLAHDVDAHLRVVTSRLSPTVSRDQVRTTDGCTAIAVTGYGASLRATTPPNGSPGTTNARRARCLRPSAAAASGSPTRAGRTRGPARLAVPVSARARPATLVPRSSHRSRSASVRPSNTRERSRCLPADIGSHCNAERRTLDD